MKYLLIATLMLMVSCAKIDHVKPELPVKVMIPQNLLTDLTPLPYIEDSTMGSLLLHDAEIINRYQECQIKFKRLKDAVK